MASKDQEQAIADHVSTDEEAEEDAEETGRIEELVVLDRDAVCLISAQRQTLRHDISTIETLDVDVTHSRIGRIENLQELTQLETLCLRQNLIKKIENLQANTSLKELDIYDNQLTKMENLDHLVNLEILDLSYNRIKKVEAIGPLVNIKKLFLVQNKIAKIENISHLCRLELLELGSNRIREIENIEALTAMTTLYIGKNKITQLQNLGTLTNLTILSMQDACADMYIPTSGMLSGFRAKPRLLAYNLLLLSLTQVLPFVFAHIILTQSNRITKIQGLEALVNLEELYLSHNGIDKVEGLETNTKLNTLDLAGNRIKKLENVRHLVEMEEFWFNDNQIASWKDLDELVPMKKLNTVYLERNPIWRDPKNQNAQDTSYRRKIMLLIPWVKQIDATCCR